MKKLVSFKADIKTQFYRVIAKSPINTGFSIGEIVKKDEDYKGCCDSTGYFNSEGLLQYLDECQVIKIHAL